MRVLFRVDASLEIGNGHVIRCLTLAHALKTMGAQCEFVCRLHKGNLLALIEQQGFVAHALPEGSLPTWLGVTWQEDASQTLRMIGTQNYDWLVVDHYDLDANWEHALRDVAKQRLAIDDLANRPHDVDLVWDQNLGRKAADYEPWVGQSCEIHVGAMRALLRPEFSELRTESRQRQLRLGIENVLISMGGVDKSNLTGKILKILREMPFSLPSNCKLTVVMGSHAPGLNDVREIAATMPWATEVCVNVTDMAQRMLSADLAIGALGTTAWERSCLGLPTLGVVLADNQLAGAQSLALSGAVLLLPTDGSMGEVLQAKLAEIQQPSKLNAMQEACYRVTDGRGVFRLTQRLQAKAHPVKNAGMRLMNESDLSTVLAWRNYPKIKQHMLTSHDIGAQEHRSWYERASQDQNRALLIYQPKDEPLGFVQFSGLFDSHAAEWGFYLSPDAPKGTGRLLGVSALYYGFTQLGVGKIVGKVMEKNEASQRFHDRLGFERIQVGLEKNHMLSFELSYEKWLEKWKAQKFEVMNE